MSIYSAVINSIHIQICMYVYSEINCWFSCDFVRGATSRGFRGFFVQSILKLVIGNLTHAQHYLPPTGVKRSARRNMKRFNGGKLPNLVPRVHRLFGQRGVTRRRPTDQRACGLWARDCKLPGNSKNFFKTSKDKAVPGKRSFKR